MAKVDVSIIIVSFNTRDLLVDCIKSVIKFTRGVSYEIIVVDNDSKDRSVEAVKKEFKKSKNLRIIANDSNLGFAEGNNQGFKIAQGEYILLLNSDTYLVEDSVSKMMEVFSDTKVGVVSCKLLNSDMSIQPSGGYFPTLPRLFGWLFFLDDLPLMSSLFKWFHPKRSFFANSHEQDWVTGAFFFIRKKCLDEVGEFSLDYFMYTEEMDFCYRAKNKGWTVLYDTGSKIVHLGQASGSSEYALKQEMRNVRLFVKKHHPVVYPLVFALVKVGVLFRTVVFAILGKVSRAKVYAKIYAETKYAL